MLKQLELPEQHAFIVLGADGLHGAARAVSQKTVHKHQKEASEMGKASFAWAWLLDERPQERARGVTIDVASAHFQTPGHAVTLLDAPGHRDFVPNMIAGLTLTPDLVGRIPRGYGICFTGRYGFALEELPCCYFEIGQISWAA